MKLGTVFLPVLACLASVTGMAQVTVSAVVNAASNAVAGLPNSAVAQGSIFVAYGKNMGPTTLAGVSH